ncbi:hypothetical protein ACFQ3B_04360 [Stackebrandtia endophytica]|uniref:hypothetical protein n=1 Tax=Stackebrandtia endophytica TaxID=1496996 RepID=UPI0011537C5F|nr:hypothetical protein [Stackebrandtia endophytica]
MVLPVVNGYLETYLDDRAHEGSRPVVANRISSNSPADTTSPGEQMGRFGTSAATRLTPTGPA